MSEKQAAVFPHAVSPAHSGTVRKGQLAPSIRFGGYENPESLTRIQSDGRKGSSGSASLPEDRGAKHEA